MFPYTTIKFWLPLLLSITVAPWRTNCEPFTTAACELPCELHKSNKTLDCENRRCSAIPIKYPRNADIDEVRLQNNQIKNITKLPDTLGSLKRIYLQHNSIEMIEEDAFENSPHLQHLNVSYNRLSKIVYSHLADLNNLLELDLSSNLLTFLEPTIITFTNLKKLQHLSLHNNLLEEIGDESFTDLENLHTVDLSFNKLHRLSPRNLDGLTALRVLNLRSNLIQTLERETFQDLRQLTTLTLSSNAITQIEDGAFDFANNIRELDLSHNVLRTVPAALNIPNVEVLSLDHNPLAELNSQSFGGKLGASLRNLSMTSCLRLRSVRKGAFMKLRVLEDLNMSNNALEIIESGAFNATSTTLHQVDLSNNKLSTLNGDLLNWPYLRDLNLAENPWNCDCHMEWMIEKAIFSQHWHKTSCWLPISLRGKLVNQIAPGNFTCTAQAVYPHPPNSALLIVIVATSVVFVLGVSIILYYNRRSICRRNHGEGKFHYVSLFNTADPALDGAVTVKYVEDDETTALKTPTNV